MSATPTDSDAASSMPLHTKPLSKTSRPSKLSLPIVLKLASSLLRQFPSDVPDSSKPSRPNPPITVTSSDDVKVDEAEDDDDGKEKINGTTGAADGASTPNPSEANGDGSAASPAVNGLKRKGGPGAKSDVSKKSSAGGDADGNLKPRGKPGPKRRKGIDGDPGAKGLWTAPAPTSHKLGPKANQGDINARLRALDRSGKPCRKWQRKGLQLSTFHGVKWDLAGWKTNKLAASGFDGDVKSDTTGSNSDAKQEPASSNVASEKSNGGGPADSNAAPASATEHASSPAPAAAVEATATAS